MVDLTYQEPETALAPGAALRAKMLAAGAPATQVDQYLGGLRTKMLGAGAPPADVDKYFGTLAPDNSNFDHAASSALDPLYAPDAKPPQSPWDHLVAGFQMSSASLMFQRPGIVEPEDTNLFEKILYGTGQAIGDIPAGTLGAVGGGAVGGAAGIETGPGAFLTAAAGAGAGMMAVPTLLREASIDNYRKGAFKSAQDFAVRMGDVGWKTGVSAVEGAVAGPIAAKVGAVVAPVAGPLAASAANAVAFSTAATGAGAAITRQMPSPDEFIAATVLALGTAGAMHGAGKMTEQGARVKANLEDIFIKTGLKPGEALKAAQADPTIQQEIFGPRGADGTFAIPELQRYAASKGIADSPEAPMKVEPQPPKDFGYVQDNPAVSRGATDWLAEKQEYADSTYARNNGIVGPTTAYFKQPLTLPTEALAGLPGARGEQRMRGDPQFDALMAEVKENGWHQDTSPILLAVNHRGEPFIVEGNTRVAVAQALNQPVVHAEVKWLNGGEEVKKGWAPDDVTKLANDTTVPGHTPETVPDVHLELFRTLENSADDAVSPAGAIGRYQIMPDTAKQYGFDPARLQDPTYNEQAARAIIADLTNKFDGNFADMAVAYNAGPGRARQWIRGGRNFDSLPRETQKYLLHAEELGAIDGGYANQQLRNTFAVTTGERFEWEPPFEGAGGSKREVFSVSDLPGDAEGAAPHSIEILRGKDGSIEGLLHSNGVTKVPSVYKDLPPEDAIRETIGADYTKIEGAGGGGGKKPPLEGEILPPGEGPKKIEGETRGEPSTQELQDRVLDIIDDGKTDRLARALDAATQLSHVLNLELDPATRVDRKMGNDKNEMTVNDTFRQGMYGSASRAAYFYENGTLELSFNAKGEPVYNQTDINSRKSAYRAVKEDGGNKKGFLAYRLARRAVELDARGIESGMDIEAARALLRAKDDSTGKPLAEQYERGAEILRANKDAALRYAADSGIYSEERLAAIQGVNRDHIVFRRVMDPSYTPRDLPGHTSRPRDPTKQIEGSKRKIVDPETADLDNSRTIIAMADRNNAWRVTIDWIADYNAAHPEKQLGFVKDESATQGLVRDLDSGALLKAELLDENGNVIPEAAKEPLVPFLLMKHAGEKLSPDHIVLLRDGRPEAWKATDPDMRDIVQIAAAGRPGEVVNVMTKLADLERTGIVSNLFFSLHVLTYGQTSGPVLAQGHPLIPYRVFFEGIMDMFDGGKAAKAWQANGGDGAAMVDINSRYLQRDIDVVFSKSEAWANVFNSVKHPLEILRNFGMAAQRMAAVGFYRQAIRKNYDASKAAMLARNAQLDHAERFMSAEVDKWARMTVFTKTIKQDFDQVLTSFRDRPITTTAKALLLLTLPTIGTIAANVAMDKALDTPDKDKFMNMPLWEYDLYTIGTGPDGVRYKWPKTPSLITFLFSVVPGRFMRYAYTHDPHEFDGMAGVAASMTLPQAIPAAALPMIETATNHSFFTGRKIVPASLEGNSGYMQYGAATTETAKGLARLLGPMSPFPVAVSPYMVDNWVKDWTGTLPLTILKALEARFVPGPVKSTDAANNPFLGSFYVRNFGAGKAIDDFYDAYDSYMTAQDDKRTAIKRDNPFEIAQTQDAQKIAKIGSYYKAINGMFAVIRGIEDDKVMTGDEKRKAIDQVATQQYLMATNALIMLRPSPAQLAAQQAEVAKVAAPQ
jgi:hypothetical protein